MRSWPPGEPTSATSPSRRSARERSRRSSDSSPRECASASATATPTDPRLTPGLIADLHHVDPIALQVAFASAGGRIMLVTDDLSTFGMPPGRYELGGAPVVIAADQPARRDDGTIAGAAVRLDSCIANVVRVAGVDATTAIRAASTVPARALGAPELGTLAAGTPADLVVLDPTELRVTATWVDGRRAG